MTYISEKEVKFIGKKMYLKLQYCWHFNFLFVDIYFFWSFKYEVIIQKIDCVDLTFFLLKLLIKKMV